MASLPRWLCLLAGLVVLALDQASKWLVARSLLEGETRSLIPGFFNLTFLRNRGSAFGLFADSGSPATSAFLIGFTAVALAVVLIALWRGPGSALAGFALALIFGGALGNLLDRLRAGSVVDFLDFHLAGYHWPAFNVADSAITLGAAALAWEILRHRPAPEAN